MYLADAFADREVAVKKQPVRLPRMSPSIYQPFNRLLSQQKPIPTLFRELINKLNKFFSISKAVLVLHCPLSNRLKLIARWEPNCFKEGVAMDIPTAHSILHRTLRSGVTLHEPVFGCNQGNNFERRILTSASTKALAICPAVSVDTVYSLISLASPVEYAFEMLDEGHFVDVFELFGELLSERNIAGIGQAF